MVVTVTFAWFFRSRSPHTAAPHLYNTQSGLLPREVPLRSIDLGEVAFTSLPDRDTNGFALKNTRHVSGLAAKPV